MAELGTIVLPFPVPIVPMRSVRSTILIASIGVIRDAGKLEAYTKALAPEHRENLLGAIAGTWIPMTGALAHYAACDTLGFSVPVEQTNGGATFKQIGTTLLGTAIRLAREAGVTPWTVFPHLQRFWLRGYDGGGLQLTQTGPKTAELRVVECPLVVSRYFRNAFRGLSVGLIELFARKAYAIERERRSGTITLRLEWA